MLIILLCRDTVKTASYVAKREGITVYSLPLPLGDRSSLSRYGKNSLLYREERRKKTAGRAEIRTAVLRVAVRALYPLDHGDPLNQHFLSEFIVRIPIVATKSIILHPDLMQKFENTCRSNLVEFHKKNIFDKILPF